MNSNGKNENPCKNEDLVTTKSCFDTGLLVAMIYFFMLYLLVVNYICNILNECYTLIWDGGSNCYLPSAIAIYEYNQPLHPTNDIIMIVA